MTQGALSYQFYTVSIGLMVAAPMSLDFNKALVPSSIINNNDISLPTELDTVETDRLQQLRETWIKSLDRPKASLSSRPEDPEEIISWVLHNMAKDADKKLLKALIENASLPIPSDYSIVLPMMSKEDKKHLISSLVPFQNTREMLLRLEDELKLPMRVVRIFSDRRDSLTLTGNTLN